MPGTLKNSTAIEIIAAGVWLATVLLLSFQLPVVVWWAHAVRLGIVVMGWMLIILPLVSRIIAMYKWFQIAVGFWLVAQIIIYRGWFGDAPDSLLYYNGMLHVAIIGVFVALVHRISVNDRIRSRLLRQLEIELYKLNLPENHPLLWVLSGLRVYLGHSA